MGSFSTFGVWRSSGSKKALGEGMTEYIIIVALIAIATTGVYSFFGQTVRQQTASMTKDFSGQSASDQTKGAQSAATSPASDAAQKKAVGDYSSGGAAASDGSK
jgi:Tfp pilus assembly protein PilV